MTHFQNSSFWWCFNGKVRAGNSAVTFWPNKPVYNGASSSTTSNLNVIFFKACSVIFRCSHNVASKRNLRWSVLKGLGGGILGNGNGGTEGEKEIEIEEEERVGSEK